MRRTTDGLHTTLTTDTVDEAKFLDVLALVLRPFESVMYTTMRAYHDENGHTKYCLNDLRFESRLEPVAQCVLQEYADKLTRERK